MPIRCVSTTEPYGLDAVTVMAAVMGVSQVKLTLSSTLFTVWITVCCPSACQVNVSGRVVEMGSTVAVKVYALPGTPFSGPVIVTCVGVTGGGLTVIVTGMLSNGF